jgi:hypothetical protein
MSGYTYSRWIGKLVTANVYHGVITYPLIKASIFDDLAVVEFFTRMVISEKQKEQLKSWIERELGGLLIQIQTVQDPYLDTTGFKVQCRFI